MKRQNFNNFGQGPPPNQFNQFPGESTHNTKDSIKRVGGWGGGGVRQEIRLGGGREAQQFRL